MARSRKRRGKDDPPGVLVVDKPRGPTSHDIVDRVRKTLRLGRVGHTGTLDPMATGVLVLCVGEATKLAGYLTQADKRYETTVTLGRETDTHDATGETTAEFDVEVTEAAVEEALEQFRGQIAQVPPMYSAIKKDGQRLYKLAREGQTVEREPRTVQIYELELTRFEPPEVDLSISCGKGTYVRTLAHDLGRALGCGGHLSSLVRTGVGSFSLEDAIDFSEIDQDLDDEGRQAILARMQTMADALGDWPLIRVDARGLAGIKQGRALGPGELAASGGGGLRPGQLVRILDAKGGLAAIGEVKSHGLQPIRVFGGGR